MPAPPRALPLVCWVTLLLLALLGPPPAARGADAPAGRHQTWEAKRLEAEAALARRDLAAAPVALLAAIAEAVHFSDSDPRVARTMETLERLLRELHAAGGAAAAERVLEEIESLSVAAGPRAALFTVDARRRLAILALQRGASARAEAYARSGLALLEERFGAEHPSSGQLRALQVAAISVRDPLSGVVQAEAQLRAALEGAGEGSPVHADALVALATAHQAAGWPERGVAPAEQGLAIQEAVLGKGAPLALATRRRLAELYAAAGRFEDAVRTADAARPFLAAGGDGPRQLVALDGFLAGVWIQRGELQQAVDAIARAENAGRGLPPGAPELEPLGLLDAAVFEEQGRLDEAHERLRRRLESEPANERGSAPLRLALARLAGVRGDVGEVEELLEPLLRGDASDVSRRGAVLNGIAYAYAINGRADEALPLAERALALLEQRLGADNPGLAPVLDTLGRAQLETGRLVEARASFGRAAAAVARRPLSVASELEMWKNRALLAKRLRDGAEREHAEAEIERREALLARRVVRPERGDDGELEAVENRESNYRFRPPGPEWVPFDARTLNPAASLGYVRQNPPTFLLIASEEVGTAAGIGLDGLATLTAASMDKNLRLVSKERRKVAELDGVLLELEGTIEGQQFRLASWLTIQGGFVHQLSVWGPASGYGQAELAELAVASFSGFAPLDAERGAAAAVEPAGDFRSKRFGYRVDLDDTEWRAWPDHRAQFAHADFGALLGEHAALVVVPVTLLGGETRLDDLAAGFESLLSGFDADTARPVEHDGREAREAEFSQELDGRRYRFRARVLQGDGVGLLAVAWVLSALGSEGDAALGVLDRIELRRADPPERVGELEPAERPRHALVFNDIGIRRLEGRRPLEAASYFELARESDPDDPVVLDNLVFVLCQLGRWADALARLEQARELVDASPKLLGKRALVREELGQTTEALADYAAAFERGFTDPGAEVRYTELLAAEGETKRARSFLDERTAANGAPELRRERARLARLDGDLPASIAELEALLAQSPADVAALLELAQSQAAAGDPAGVVRSCDRALAAGPSSFAHYLKAQAQIELGDPAGGKASLEAALALEPESEAARELLAHASAMLGQGENSQLKTPIPPVAMPARVARLVEGAGAPPDAAGASALTLSLAKGFHFEDGKSLRSTLWWKVKVLDQRGVEDLSRLEFDFHPLNEEIHVASLVVRDASGRQVAVGDPSEAYVLDATEDEVASSMRRVYLPVRGLAVGATIELVLSQREKAPPTRFTYVDWQFSRDIPVGRSLLFVTGDLDPILAKASAGVSHERGDAWQAWWMDGPPAARYEPNQPLRHTYLPFVRLGDRRDDWAKLAEAYLEDIREPLQPSGAVGEPAREAVGGLDEPDAKARALAGYVQRLLTYRAIAFGRRARLPKRADEVLQLRYGDCKDHALLLHQLLDAAGVRSRLALASLTSVVDPDVPTLDQFDHMIVECLDCTEARFLDATDKGLAPGHEVPRGLGGATVLVLDAEHPRLETVPKPALASHYATSEREVAATADGAVRVEEQLEFGGYPAAWVRDFLRATDRLAWKEAMHRVLVQPSDVIEAIEVEDLEATEKPLRLRLTYSVRDGFSRSARGWVGRTPMLWESELLAVDPASNRSSPFELATPMRFAADVRVVGPSGSTLQPPAQREVERAGRFTELRGRVGRDGAGLRMRYEVIRHAGEGPAEAYESAREEAGAVFEFLRQPLEAEPEPP